MSKAKVRNIGGYEFHVVKEGLDEAEVTDLVRKLLGNGDRADGQHQSLFSMQEFAKKMEVLATEAEQVAEQVKQGAEAERTSLLTEAEHRAGELVAEAEHGAHELIAEAEHRAGELIVEAETAAAAMRKEAAEVQHKARELVAETERAEAAMRSQAQELLQVAQSKAEQVITKARHLAEHRIPVVTDRMCRELVSMLDGLEAEFKASPGSQGQTAEEAFRKEPEEAVAVPVAPEGEAEAQPEAEEPEEAGGRPVPALAIGGQTAEEAFEEEPEEAVAAPVALEGEAEAQPEAVEQEEAAPILYEGRVLLVVPGGTGALELRRLQDRLCSFPEVKILTQGGTMGGGSTLTLSVEKPLPLIQRLLEMPNVESAKGATPDRPQRPKGILRPFGRKSEAQSSPPVIRLCLKNGGDNPTPRQPQDQEP